MLKHYFHTFFAGLRRHRLYALINVLGLSAGMTCFILISLYVKDELSFEKHHEQYKRIFRVVGKISTEGHGERSSSCPFPLGPALQQDYPDLVQEVVRFFNFQEPHKSLKYKEKLFNESGIYLADSNVFKVFDIKLAEGDPSQVLTHERSIVMTRKMAARYFGDEEPLGKMVELDGNVELMVTGILDDQPAQSHLQFEALISFSTVRYILGPNYNKNWVWNPCWTYVLLPDQSAVAELQDQLPLFVNKHYPDFLKTQVEHNLQALEDIHLHSDLEFEMGVNSNATTVYILGFIGVIILLTGCINYMNLATARSVRRARETGIRKVSGAYHYQLITQYLFEAICTGLLAIVVSLALIELLLPFFNDLSGKDLSLHEGNPFLVFLLIATGILTGIIAGTYPAFVLSAYSPVQVLKGRTGRGSIQLQLRRLLVVLQFVISLVLIISTLIINRQLNHLRQVDPGYNTAQVLMIPLRPSMSSFFDSFISDIENVSGVVSTATMNDIIGSHHNNHEFNYKGMEKGKWIYFPCLLVNEDFVQTMQLQLVAGRDFSDQFPGDDSLSVLVNETMVRQMGWTPEEALGEQFFTPSGYERIIGVLKDFHFVSMEQEVKPFVLDMPHPYLRNYWTRFIAIRYEAAKIDDVLEALKARWENLTTSYPFDYFFLDQYLDNQYRKQDKLAGLISVFSILSIFIACLGLFALASYSAEQRTREFGIRKVLGATGVDIIKLLSGEFLYLILIAVIIALPLSWYIMERWLQGFSSRVEISADVFVAASLLLLLVAAFTVLFKAIQAASASPGKSLRYE